MPWADGRCNVRLPLCSGRGLARLRRSRVWRRRRRALDFQASRRSDPREFSGGLTTRASIARALVTEPPATADGRAVCGTRRDHAFSPEQPFAGAVAGTGQDRHSSLRIPYFESVYLSQRVVRYNQMALFASSQSSRSSTSQRCTSASRLAKSRRGCQPAVSFRGRMSLTRR